MLTSLQGEVLTKEYEQKKNPACAGNEYETK